MLFRRFLVVTAIIALFAVVLLRFVEATGGPRGEFAVGERLRLMQKMSQIETCVDGDRHCQLSSNISLTA